jgi:methyl-accepting chemotaxis protein
MTSKPVNAATGDGVQGTVKDTLKEQYIEMLPTPVMAIDREFKVTYINPAGAALLNMSLEQCAGRKCYELFKTPHCRSAECRCDQAMRRDGVFTGQTVAAPDGVNMPIQYTGMPVKDAAGAIVGALEYVVDISETRRAMDDASEKVEYLQNLPTPIMAIDKSFTVRYMNLAGANVLGLRQDDCIGRKCYDLFKTTHCRTAECRCSQAMTRDGVFSAETVTHQGGRDIIIEYTGAPVKDNRGDIIGAVEFVLDITDRKNVLNDIITVAEGLAQGDLSRRIESKYTGDFGAIAQNLNTAMVNIETTMNEITGACQKLADKDLTVHISGDFAGAYGAIVANLNDSIKALHDIVAQVAEAVGQINAAGEQISAGAQGVAEGTSEQASSLEEISSSLEEMASMTKQNAGNADQARALAQEANERTVNGNQAMERMNRAISDIKKSSEETAKIVKTIDEIAFQTNLLALNAAVEAARAGEAGKGFAVVAEEVRNLAMRSAEAAKSTADLITESTQNSNNGVAIADEVGGALAQIADAATKVNNLVSEIAAASKEQSQGIEQINIAVGQMDKVTQTNASNAEESASAAEELASQAKALSDMVGDFKVAARQSLAADSAASLLQGLDISILHQLVRQAKAQLPAKRASARPDSRKPALAGRPRAETVIPFTDEDFGEF